MHASLPRLALFSLFALVGSQVSTLEPAMILASMAGGAWGGALLAALWGTRRTEGARFDASVALTGALSLALSGLVLCGLLALKGLFGGAELSEAISQAFGQLSELFASPSTEQGKVLNGLPAMVCAALTGELALSLPGEASESEGGEDEDEDEGRAFLLLHGSGVAGALVVYAGCLLAANEPSNVIGFLVAGALIGILGGAAGAAAYVMIGAQLDRLLGR